MSAPDLLIEIGTEELPPKALPVLSRRFGEEIQQRLTQAGLNPGDVRLFATPRRLAVIVCGVPLAQPEQTIERRGPALNAARGADGQPTPAALGFARSCGVAFEALETIATDKGEWLVFRAQQAGKPTRELLGTIIDGALAALPVPKRMRWGAGSEEFVRPVHWVVVLHGADVVPVSVLGITSGRETRGHRFMGAARIALSAPDSYVARLEDEGKVVADFAARRDRIASAVRAEAAAVGCQPIIDEALLEEVTALVEWPVAVTGTFDAHFLEVPREALIATMQGNQKYFPLEGADGRLSNRFITISNIDSPRPEFIRDGNERVIRPRFSDAAFFFDKDRKTPLAARKAQLGDIVFERRLGSLLDKTQRVEALAVSLAGAFGANPEAVSRAAALSRCDLVSEMVGEFPELQGVMGRYYAAHDGEATDVAQAIGEFYLPRFAGDAIPASPAGRCVACADRLDTLVGIFSVGGAPTGDKDPYALRRAALGSLRLCIEGEAAVDLAASLDTAALACGGETANVTQAVFDFILERSRGYFSERGIGQDVIEAVLSTRPTRPLDLARRVQAVAQFADRVEARALAAANKRIANILRKAADDLTEATTSVLCEAEELALATAVDDVERRSEAFLARGDYAPYLGELASLHAPVNAFFEAVLVMSEDTALRRARLGLLARIQRMFLRVADVAHLSH